MCVIRTEKRKQFQRLLSFIFFFSEHNDSQSRTYVCRWRNTFFIVKVDGHSPILPIYEWICVLPWWRRRMLTMIRVVLRWKICTFREENYIARCTYNVHYYFVNGFVFTAMVEEREKKKNGNVGMANGKKLLSWRCHRQTYNSYMICYVSHVRRPYRPHVINRIKNQRNGDGNIQAAKMKKKISLKNEISLTSCGIVAVLIH